MSCSWSLIDKSYSLMNLESDEQPLPWRKMHGFSALDGFQELSESQAEMIKYIANEPSVGLFYVQQHARSAIPNVVNLRNNVAEKTREVNLQTEDLEDSISMVKSMKECGYPVADEMIRDIRKSLTILSTKQPRRGLISNSTSGFLLGRSSSWAPPRWGNNKGYVEQDSTRMSGYFSTVIKTAKEKASNLKWSQLEPKELMFVQDKNPLPYPSTLEIVASPSTCSSMPDFESDELPLSSQAADDPQEEGEDLRVNPDISHNNLLPLSENYEVFRADKQAKLEEWLGGTGENLNKLEERQ